MLPPEVSSASSKLVLMRMLSSSGAAVTVAVSLVPSGQVLLFIGVFVAAQIAFTAANVFYDGFLPELTTDATIDRASARGFAYGYVGGGLFLILALAVILLSGEDGVSGMGRETAARVAIAAAGVWWAGFSIVSLRRLPRAGQERAVSRSGRNGTWAGLLRMRDAACAYGGVALA